MSWNDDEGPWGSSNKGQQRPPEEKKGKEDPWNGARRRGPSGGAPNNAVPPPDFDEIIGWFKTMWGRYGASGHRQSALIAILVLLALWLASGLYLVAADQNGVVMRFGAFDRVEQPGLRYHLPYPVESVLLPVVTSQNEIQVGFRRTGGRSADTLQRVPEESMMLTQDENIINVEFTLFWRVSDVGKYLFEIRNPENTIKMAGESVMREVIGQNKLQFALTDGRSQIADEARIRLQQLMDEYNAGVVITQINLQTVSVPDEVKAAFQDVVNARLDQERFQNQAAAHANKVIPDAKGQAAQLIQQAMAYRDQKVAIAKGEADRFKDVLAAYSVAKDVTAKRLYLETMEALLENAKKVVMDNKSSNVTYLPLDELLKNDKKDVSGKKGNGDSNE